MTWFPFIYMFVLVNYYKLPFRSDYSSEIKIINRLRIFLVVYAPIAENIKILKISLRFRFHLVIRPKNNVRQSNKFDII